MDIIQIRSIKDDLNLFNTKGNLSNNSVNGPTFVTEVQIPNVLKFNAIITMWTVVIN